MFDDQAGGGTGLGGGGGGGGSGGAAVVDGGGGGGGGGDSVAVEMTENPLRKKRKSMFAQPKFMEGFFKQVDQIKADIDGIRGATKSVAGLQHEAAEAVGDKAEREVSDRLNAVVTPANKRCMRAKATLKAIGTDTKALEKDKDAKPSEIRIRKNMHATLSQKFVAVARGYQKAQDDYKRKIQEKVARQVKVVKPEATMEEIDMTMRSGGGAGAVYRAAILQAGADPIAEAYNRVADKYKDVLKLERSVEELHQMFLDMAFLVEQQGEMLDQIEFQVNSAAEYIGEGNQQLGKALDYRKKARKKWCCIICIVVVIMAAILGPVLRFVPGA